MFVTLFERNELLEETLMARTRLFKKSGDDFVCVGSQIDEICRRKANPLIQYFFFVETDEGISYGHGACMTAIEFNDSGYQAKFKLPPHRILKWDEPKELDLCRVLHQVLCRVTGQYPA